MTRPRTAGPAAVLASPVARRLAEEHDIDLATTTGSGPRGRIVRADVEFVLRQRNAPRPDAVTPQARDDAGAAAPVPSAQARDPGAQAAYGKGETRQIEPTRTQRTIARRMAEAKATVPEFAIACSVDMSPCAELRAELKRGAAPDAAVPSFNDMVVRACALALREHPRANASYVADSFELHGRVNVGVAVAADDALLVPTVVDADLRSLTEIAAETRRLAERVRVGSITPAELADGTFTVSNLGMFGVTSFQAVINPPQAAILAVGAIEQRAVAVDGQVAIRPLMEVSVTCDHRILYGADAAAFLASIRRRLEAPMTLLV